MDFRCVSQNWRWRRCFNKRIDVHWELFLFVGGDLKTGFIAKISTLIKELSKLGDDFITVKIDGEDREYIIDKIIHEKTHCDNDITHVCLICRDGGQGCIKRWAYFLRKRRSY